METTGDPTTAPLSWTMNPYVSNFLQAWKAQTPKHKALATLNYVVFRWSGTFCQVSWVCWWPPPPQRKMLTEGNGVLCKWTNSRELMKPERVAWSNIHYEDKKQWAFETKNKTTFHDTIPNVVKVSMRDLNEGEILPWKCCTTAVVIVSSCSDGQSQLLWWWSVSLVVAMVSISCCGDGSCELLWGWSVWVVVEMVSLSCHGYGQCQLPSCCGDGQSQ